jgi:hypothetical protein
MAAVTIHNLRRLRVPMPPVESCMLESSRYGQLWAALRPTCFVVRKEPVNQKLSRDHPDGNRMHRDKFSIGTKSSSANEDTARSSTE